MSCVTSKREVRNALVSRNSCIVDIKLFDATSSDERSRNNWIIIPFELIGFTFFYPFFSPLEVAISSKVFESKWPPKTPFKLSTCTLSASFSQYGSSFYSKVSSPWSFTSVPFDFFGRQT